MCTTTRKSQSSPVQETNNSPGAVNGANKINDSTQNEDEWTLANIRKMGIVWRNVIIMAYIHTVGTYGLYVWFSGQLRWTTIILGKTLKNCRQKNQH